MKKYASCFVRHDKSAPPWRPTISSLIVFNKRRFKTVDRIGDTMDAIFYSNFSGEAVPLKCLLDLGYPLLGENKKSALHVAATEGSPEAVALLFAAHAKRGVRACAQDNEGNTPLHLAAQRGDIRIVAEFLKHVEIAGHVTEE